MIIGQEMLSTSIATRSGKVIPLRIVMPDNTVDNIKELSRQQRKWEQVASDYRHRYEASELPRDVAFRATFASNVLWQAANMISQNEPGVWIALSNDDIVGVIIHSHRPGNKIYVDYVTIAPQFHPGAPDGDKPKGIGTSMLESIKQEAAQQNVSELVLHSLDEQAFRFWQSHGFSDSLPGHKLHATPSAVYCYIADDPDAGDDVDAGEPETIPGFRFPDEIRAMSLESKELPVVGETKFKVMPGLNRTGKRGVTILGRRDLPPIIDKRDYKKGSDLPWILAHEIGHQCIFDLARAMNLRDDATEIDVARWLIDHGVDYHYISFREPTLALHANRLVDDIKAGRQVNHILAGEFVAEVVAHYITSYNDPRAYHFPADVESVVKDALETLPYERRVR